MNIKLFYIKKLKIMDKDITPKIIKKNNLYNNIIHFEIKKYNILFTFYHRLKLCLDLLYFFI